MNKQALKIFIKEHWKLILAVLYLISPIDIIPDVLIPLGYTEDILILITAVVEYYLKLRKKEKKRKKDVIEGELAE